VLEAFAEARAVDTISLSIATHKLVPDHIGVKKAVACNADDQIARKYMNWDLCRFFHHLGATRANRLFKTPVKSTISRCVVMARQPLPIHGVMWHPEREKANSHMNT
jgi:hypothetical protein